MCSATRSTARRSARAARARLLTAAVKYHVCKTAPALVYEAMECLGGNGVAERVAAALSRGAGQRHREAPATDVPRRAARASMRAAGRAVLGAGVERGRLPRRDRALSQTLLSSPGAEAKARAGVGRLALLAAAGALRHRAPVEVAELFARTRLAGGHDAMFGASDIKADAARRLLERALPSA